jgi:hypothetical protein
MHNNKYKDNTSKNTILTHPPQACVHFSSWNAGPVFADTKGTIPSAKAVKTRT